MPDPAHGRTSTKSGPRIRRITLLRLAVPLKREIKHASHTRTSSENLVVRVELAGGTLGHGEGVPRPYVTGETIESTFESLARHDWARIVGEPADFAGAVRTIGSIRLPENEADPRGMAGNAARCALEIALLDAYGRAFGEPIGRAVELAEFSGLRRYATVRGVRYGGAITADSFRKEIRSAIKFRVYGFRDVKTKVGVEGQDDARRLAWIRRILGGKVELRIDANEAWKPAELIERTQPLRRYAIAALEQPVPHAEVGSLAELRPKLGMPVMLDESLCGYPDAERTLREGTGDILNVRLSKCGGILPSLRIIALAHRSGLGLQLGCHPGETAILSAAGRHVAGRVDGISWVEGSYDRHILRENVSREDITFGFGGRAKPLAGPGLGISIDPEAVDAMATERRELAYD
ncbi:dipeptide epimerase [Aquisphaera insulae]|uniref:dipeptide epimerase n=1 Tax=Aquisphaera insulae TaxID=2712864 RepID=UPI0013ED44F4|nr:dipeptide epimerase [Aquisphaera insulae]